MPQHQGYSATITSRGRELVNYNVNVEGRTITSYIESVQGQEFVIHFADYTHSRTPVQVRCFLDGKWITTKTCSYLHPTVRIWGVRQSITSKATLRFADVHFVDDDEAEGRIGPGMGTIELKMYRVRQMHIPVDRQHYKHIPVKVDSGPVSEKSKKAGWHQVALGPERSSAWKPSNIKYARLDPTELPYMIFRFYYRPRAILEAEGFMSRVAQTSQETKPAVKREQRKRPSRKSFKQEAESTIPKYDPDEVIELDSDDDDAATGGGSRRRCSPIRVGAGAGETIDLTLDE